MAAFVCNFHLPLTNSINTKRTQYSPFLASQVWISSLCSNQSSANKITLTIKSMATNPVVKQIIPNKKGQNLVGLLHDTGSKQIVVLCHGFRSNKEQKTMVNLATALSKEGISAFRFDFSGNGESDGSFTFANYWGEVDDIRAVIEHFTRQNRVVSVILGHSKGGSDVVLYASKYHDISAVVNVSGRYDLSKGIEERFGKEFMEKIKQDRSFDVKNKAGTVVYSVTLESLMDRLSTKVPDACLQITRECRVLTVHGSADEIIPVEDALEFDKRIPNHKLQIIKEADHSYTSHQAELASAVLNFIKEILG